MSWLRQAILDISDYRIAYCEAGPGASACVVLCIHGAGGNRDAWIPLMRDLAERSIRSLALELPGHGASSIAQISDIKEYRRVVLQFIEAKKFKSICLAGHSMGGAVVLESVLSDPELLNGVVLIGTGAKLRVRDSILGGVKNHFEETVNEIIGYAFSPAADPSFAQEGARSLLECHVDTLYHDFVACDRFDVIEKLESISTPALILCGEDDLLTPPKYSQFLMDKMSHAKLSIISKAGHMVMLEQPRVVGDAISQFLGEF